MTIKQHYNGIKQQFQEQINKIKKLIKHEQQENNKPLVFTAKQQHKPLKINTLQ